MLTKRESMLLLAMMSFGQAKAAETQDSKSVGGFVLYDWKQPVTWIFSLDRVKEFTVERGGKSLTISADEVWRALGGA